MLITYEWPDQINLNSSDTIRMKITSNNAIAASQLTATVTGNYRLAGATPEEVGTPGLSYDNNGNPVTTSVKDAFGPKYRVFATAQLLAATFDVKTFDLTEQSLDQGSVAWLWDIKPNTLGSQVVGLALDLLCPRDTQRGLSKRAEIQKVCFGGESVILCHTESVLR